MSGFSRVLVVFLGLVVMGAPVIKAQGCTQRLKEAFTYKSLKGGLALFQDGRCSVEKKVLTWHYMRDGSQEPSFKDYTHFARTHATWPWMFKVRRGAESRINDDTSPHEILAWFEENPVKTLEGSLALITVLGKKSPEKARAKAKEIWQEISLSPEESATFLKRFGSLLSPADHLARARGFLAKGDVSPAATLTSYVAPSHRPLLEACVALMQGDKKAGKLYQKAHTVFREDLDLRLAYLIWLRKTTKLDGAKYLLRQPRLTSYAPVTVWKEAHILLRRALEKGDRSLAARLATLGESTSGEDYAQAQWLKGYFALDKTPQAAFHIFEKTHKSMSSSISRARFAYWAGRALEKTGSDKATQWYQKASRHPSTFYGQLAAKKLGKNLPAPTELHVPTSLLKQLKQDARYRAAHALYEIGRERDGSEFLFMMIKTATSSEERAAILKLASALSRTQVVGLAKEASMKGEFYHREAYPCLGSTHTQALQDVNSALLHAVIRKESSFDARTMSSAGAVGLTQMLPSTAKEVAKKLNLAYSQDKLLNDDVFNVRIGARYLKSRVEEFKGDEILALVAYNAGIKYALEWIQMFGDPRGSADPIEWVELIPFGETRNYVHRVLEAKGVYEKMLAPQTEPAPQEALSQGETSAAPKIYPHKKSGVKKHSPRKKKTSSKKPLKKKAGIPKD